MVIEHSIYQFITAEHFQVIASYSYCRAHKAFELSRDDETNYNLRF